MSTSRLPDQQLQAAILKRFEWAPDIDPEHVGVAVRDGVVTLSGRGASRAEKRAAVRTADEVQGVVAVVDEIFVPAGAGGVPDEQLVDAVRAVLRSHPRLDGNRVEVRVHDQVVTLTGRVDSGEQRRAARRAVQGVLGVRTVIDELELPPAPTAGQTKARLIEVLGQAGAADVEQLDIRLDGHVATLEGNVHSWYERRMAERAARSVPGVTDVRNMLVVTF